MMKQFRLMRMNSVVFYFVAICSVSLLASCASMHVPPDIKNSVPDGQLIKIFVPRDIGGVSLKKIDGTVVNPGVAELYVLPGEHTVVFDVEYVSGKAYQTREYIDGAVVYKKSLLMGEYPMAVSGQAGDVIYFRRSVFDKVESIGDLIYVDKKSQARDSAERSQGWKNGCTFLGTITGMCALIVVIVLAM